MRVTAEAVSATLTTCRNCTIEINNISERYFLINPKVYMSSGFCQHPPQPTIPAMKSGLCSFVKDEDYPTGAVGVLTYDLFHIGVASCSELLAIMFSVPYDYNLYENRLAVGVFEKSCACDEKLYELMYEGQDQDCSNFVRSEKSGSGLEYVASNVDLRATMSSIGKAIIKMELYDKSGS